MVDVGTLRVGGEQLVPRVDRDARGRHQLAAALGRIVVLDDDDVAQAGQVVHHRRHPVGEGPLDHEHGRARVVQLVTEVLALVRGVDRHGDVAAAHRSPPGEHASAEFSRRAATRSPCATPRAASPWAMRAPTVRDLRRGELRPADVEVLAVGVLLQPSVEQRGDRGLLATDPCSVVHGAAPSVLTVLRLATLCTTT